MRGYFTVIVALMMLTTAFGQEPVERIIRFHADIVIDTTGRIEVTEHIKVYAGGINIRRGIERDVPLYRKDRYGKRVRMETNVLSVQCNGDKVAYSTRNDGDNTILRIGNPDILLKPGEYDYAIVYESFGHVGFFDEYDEFYWNVTGNGWVFPVERTSASITLPAGTSAIAGQTSCYAGMEGVTTTNCSYEDRGNTQVFATTSPLAPHEGLTVAVAFPRDIVHRPPPESGVYPVGWLIFVFYCLYAVLKVGKRPRKPVVIPSFKPPRDLSPADVNYLYTRAYKDKAVTATYVDMAVKLSMTIRCEEKKKYSFINNLHTERLRPVERQMHNALFNGNRGEIDVIQSNWKRFSQADTCLKNDLTKRWNITDYFRENKKYTVRAGIILFVVLGLYTLLSLSHGDVIMAFCLASPFIGAAVMRLWSVGDFDMGAVTLLGVLFVPIILMIGALFLHFDAGFEETIHWLSAVFYGVMSAGYLWYVSHMRMFTPEGARLASELEGFRMYMKTAEENRLNILAPPERTLELFEKLLPYAFALGVSNEWCRKFDDVLSRIDYHPDWYDSREDFRKIRFASTFSGLSATVGNAKTEKTSYTGGSSGSGSWSSGSSGGGRVGGGGGGGGGRGW